MRVKTTFLMPRSNPNQLRPRSGNDYSLPRPSWSLKFAYLRTTAPREAVATELELGIKAKNGIILLHRYLGVING